MTSVIIRRVTNNLERMVRSRDGIRASEALAAAQANLETIEEICVQELDRRLAPLSQFARDYPVRRPPDSVLEQVSQDAGAALTACSGLNRPMLGKALLMLCAMADALSHTRYWPDGALAPAIATIALLRSGQLPDPVAEDLISELQRCLVCYIQHADEALQRRSD